ncbi:unnamed protein product [Effrenium voratum]|uniref:Uncharacterized protein n=1 Tax=Effrenium voratum TaxID=2562239 RepID=A0AA36IJC8_9DINO|nr:unnamed protein product [Effrenium voratum]
MPCGVDIGSLMARVKAAGVDYDQIYAALIERLHAMQKKVSSWSEADFRYRVSSGRIFEGPYERHELEATQAA